MHTSAKTTFTHSGFVKYLLLEQYDLHVPLEHVMKKVVCNSPDFSCAVRLKTKYFTTRLYPFSRASQSTAKAAD
jgi:hypothetical protein